MSVSHRKLPVRLPRACLSAWRYAKPPDSVDLRLLVWLSPFVWLSACVPASLPVHDLFPRHAHGSQSRLPRHLGAHLPAQGVAPLLGGRHVLVGRESQRSARGGTARSPWRQGVVVDVAQPLARLHDQSITPLGGGHLVRGEGLAPAVGGECHRCRRVDGDRATRAVGEERGALPLRLAPRVQGHLVRVRVAVRAGIRARASGSGSG